MTFKLTGRWIAGFVDAEGCFSIHMTTTTKLIGVSFNFFISQKDPEPLIMCLEFLEKYRKKDPTLVNTKLPNLVQGNETMDIKIMQHNILLKIIRPFFEDFPLLSSKWQDCQLFFAALDIYKNRTIPKYVRVLNVANIMFAMNTDGPQRRNPLTYYEDLVKPLFGSQQEWESCRFAAQEIVKEILQRPYPSLTRNLKPILEDYFLGLITGDGCFHSDFDCRKKRTVTVRKS